MRGLRIGLVVVAVIAAIAAHPGAVAQPAGDGSDILVEPEPAGSGSSSAPPAAETGSAANESPVAVVKDPKVAKRWLQAAAQLVKKGDALTRAKKPDDAKQQFENAVIAYQRAIESSDNVNLYLDLANLEDKLGKFDEALKHVRLVLAATTGVKPDILKKAAAKLDSELTKVGLVTLVVTPDGATVTLGETELGLTPLTEQLVLLPGVYKLSLVAPGFQAKDEEIKVEAGSESERTIVLDPVKIIVAPVRPELERTSDANPATGPSKLPLYIGGGVAIVATSAAIVTGILAAAQHSTYTAPGSTNIAREDAKANGETLALATDVLLGTAAVAAGFTAAWYYFKYSAPKPKPESNFRAPAMTKVEVMPWAQPHGGGVAVGGGF